MGFERSIPFTTGEPTWAQVATVLARTGEPPVVRMIDGLPAFPDEAPADDWREIRVSFPAGMVTIRRETKAWVCVIWGSADPTLLAACDRVAEAVAFASQTSPVDE